MKMIPLSQGKEAIVDDKDYDYLMQWKWYAKKEGNSFYAARKASRCGVNRTKHQKTIRMHREIMRLQNKYSDDVIDHINQDGLDNRRCNIRICKQRENMRNCKLNRNNRLGIKGVTKRNNKYIARITYNKKLLYLGIYETPTEAHSAYQKAALQYHGSFARFV